MSGRRPLEGSTTGAERFYKRDDDAATGAGEQFGEHG